MRRLYLDVDGVLLGTIGGRVVLAAHASEFIEIAIRHFDVYWLTTHCGGDSRSVLQYLRPFAGDALLERMAAIQPTRFSVLKTEALEGDFYWIDDQPLRAELDDLRRRNLFDRWIEVNTRDRPDDLLFACDELSRIVSGTCSGRRQ